MQWHHIVEQTPNKGQFPEEWLHNDLNVVRLDKKTHTAIFAYYSTQNKALGTTPREYMKNLPYEDQYQYGIDVLREFKGDIP